MAKTVTELEIAYYVSLWGSAAVVGQSLQDLRYKYFSNPPVSGGGGGGGTSVGGAFPLTEYGYIAASISPDSIFTMSNSGGCAMARIFIPATKIITGLGVYVGVVQTTPTGENSFAVYSDAGNLLGQTASDATLFTAQGLRFKDLISPIAASSTDRFVWAGYAQNNNGSAPNIAYVNTQYNVLNAGKAANKRRTYYISGGRSSWPATINPLTEGSDNYYIAFLAVY